MYALGTKSGTNDHVLVIRDFQEKTPFECQNMDIDVFCRPTFSRAKNDNRIENCPGLSINCFQPIKRIAQVFGPI